MGNIAKLHYLSFKIIIDPSKVKIKVQSSILPNFNRRIFSMNLIICAKIYFDKIIAVI